ncbi:MAG: small basic protein [Candidatus Omnitrophota bacterium]
MSVHPSLLSKGKNKKNRSVLKRFERLKELLEKEKWKPGDSVFRLVKVKTVRLKLKKAKKAVEETAAGAAAGQTTPAAAAGNAAEAKKTEKKKA